MGMIREQWLRLSTPKSQQESLANDRSGNLPPLSKNRSDARLQQFSAMTLNRDRQTQPPLATIGNPFQRAVEKRAHYQLARALNVAALIQKIKRGSFGPGQPAHGNRRATNALETAGVSVIPVRDDMANELSFVVGLLRHLTGKYTEDDLTAVEGQDRLGNLNQKFIDKARELLRDLQTSYAKFSNPIIGGPDGPTTLEKRLFNQTFADDTERNVLNDRMIGGQPLGTDPFDPRMKFLMMLIEKADPSYKEVNVHIYETLANGELNLIHNTHSKTHPGRPTVCMVRMQRDPPPPVAALLPGAANIPVPQFYFAPLVMDETAENLALQRFYIVQQKTNYGLIESWCKNRINEERRTAQALSFKELVKAFERPGLDRESKEYVELDKEHRKRTDPGYEWKNLKRPPETPVQPETDGERARRIFKERLIPPTEAGVWSTAHDALKVPVPAVPAISPAGLETNISGSITALRPQLQALIPRTDRERITRFHLETELDTINKKIIDAVSKGDLASLRQALEVCQVSIGRIVPETVRINRVGWDRVWEHCANVAAPTLPENISQAWLGWRNAREILPLSVEMEAILLSFNAIKTSLLTALNPTAVADIAQRSAYEIYVLKECGTAQNHIQMYQDAREDGGLPPAWNGERTEQKRNACRLLRPDGNKYSEIIDLAIAGNRATFDEAKARVDLEVENPQHGTNGQRQITFEVACWIAAAIKARQGGNALPNLPHNVALNMRPEERAIIREITANQQRTWVEWLLGDGKRAHQLLRKSESHINKLRNDPKRLKYLETVADATFFALADDQLKIIGRCNVIDDSLRNISDYIEQTMSIGAATQHDEAIFNNNAVLDLSRFFDALNAARTP